VAQKSEFRVQDSYHYNWRSPVRWFVSHSWRYKLLLAASFLFKTLALISYSLAPVFVGQAAQAMIKPAPGQGVADPLLLAALAVLGALLSDGITNLIGSLTVQTLAMRIEADSRQELYANLLGKSQAYHDRQRVGDVMARATDDVQQINGMMHPGLSIIYETIMAIIIPLAFIASINIEMVLVPVLFVVGYVITLRLYMRRLEPVAFGQREAFGTMNAGLEESISGIETVKASAQEGFEREKFRKNARTFRDFFVRQGKIEALYLPLLVFGLTVAMTFLHALWLYGRAELSIANIIAIMGLVNILGFPAFISSWTFSLVQLGIASAGRVLKVLRAESELDENAGGYSKPIEGDILFEDVSFAYEGTDHGIYDLSFHIKPGQTVAIVGQTGSGKSTLTQLVNRTYDVTKGRILIDEQDVRQWDLNALRSQISQIEQDVFLFSRTIRENIAFGRPDASQEEVEEAAQGAQAHDFILSFEKGYDTEIGERGVTLSGGQRQRIALARAFLNNPRILILDDSTSAIDSATEDEIQKAVQKARQGRTTLLITHRLSQIRWADHILVLDRGTLVASGSHNDLLRRSPHYRRIFSRYDVALPPLEASEPIQSHASSD
jgi:ATP-binding cassette, subfamily B, bacterial